MYCVVKDCKSIWKPSCEIIFHSFPKDTRKRNIWLSMIHLKGKFYESARICSLHFKHDDYDPENPRTLLNSAVPHYFPLSCGSCGLTSTTEKEIKTYSELEHSSEPPTKIACVNIERLKDYNAVLKIADKITMKSNEETSVNKSSSLLSTSRKKELYGMLRWSRSAITKKNFKIRHLQNEIRRLKQRLKDMDQLVKEIKIKPCNCTEKNDIVVIVCD